MAKKINFKSGRSHAELLVSALLTNLTGQVDVIESKQLLVTNPKPIPLGLRVKADPNILSCLIREYIASAYLPKEQQAIAAIFSNLDDLKQNEAVINAIDCLVKLELAIDERAKPANKRKREFLISFQQSPCDYTQHRYNLTTLFEDWESKTQKKETFTLKNSANSDLTIQLPVELVASWFPVELCDYTQDRIKILESILPSLKAIALSKGWDASVVILSLIRFLIANGKFDEAYDLLSLTENSWEVRSPELNLVISDRQYYLGLIHIQKEEFTTAEVLLNKSREIRQELFGNEHSHVADCVYALGTIYLGTQRLEKAETCFRVAIAIREKLQQNLAIANSMNGLAEVLAAPCYLKYNPVEAENLYQKSANLILTETKSHPFLASSKIGQANLLARQGKYKVAEILYLEAIAMLETLFGKQYPQLAKPKSALAKVLCSIQRIVIRN